MVKFSFQDLQDVVASSSLDHLAELARLQAESRLI
jgi:hypothetical protein